MTGGRYRIGTLVPTGAGDIHVREDGPADGEPLVLLHGFCGSMHWFGRIVALLTDTYRVIRIDLLAHGCTGGGAADADVQVAMVESVLDKLGVSRATVIGHSFGADVAVGLAERSDRIDRLVIITQAPDYSDATLPPGRALMTVPVISAALYRLAGPLSVALGALFRVAAANPAGRELGAQGLRDLRAMDLAMFRVILIDRRDRLAARPLDAQVRAAGVPTLAILGGRDAFYGDRAAERYEAAGANVVILPESGHSPMVQMPGPTARVIRDFLDAEPIAAPGLARVDS